MPGTAAMQSFASPEAFIAALDGWRLDLVTMLRAAVDAGGAFDQQIKWGNLVFASNGLAILIRAEEHRVLLGFWRGKRLTGIEPRIKPSGKYELGNIVLFEGDSIEPAQVTRLAAAAADLNRTLGDPTARH